MKEKKITAAQMTTLQKQLTKSSLKFTMGCGGFFATVFYNLHKSFDESVETAATDGKNILINPHFFKSLNEKERVFLLAHEAMHVCFLHMIRQNDKDPVIWNFAGDYVINLLLSKDPSTFGTPIKDILLDSKYEGMNSEQVYDILVANAIIENPELFANNEISKNGHNEGTSNSSGQNSGNSNKNDQSSNQSSKGEKGKGTDGKDNSSSTPNSRPKAPLSGDVSYSPLGDKDKSSTIDFDEIRDMVLTAAQCAKSDGNNSSGSGWGTGIAEIDNLINKWLHPKIKWQDALYDYINIRTREAYCWSHRDRRFRDVYLPRLFSMGVGRMVIYLDESGSILDEQIQRFMSEINAIKDMLNPELIDIIPFTEDIMLEKKLTIDCDTPMPTDFTRHYTGGTECQPIFDHMLVTEYNVRIILTDGYVDTTFLNSPKYAGMDMIWCIIENPKFECDVGKILHVTTN